MKTVILVSVSIIISTIGCAQGSRPADAGFQTLSRNGYSILRPVTWRVDTSHAFGADVFIASPKENPADKFVENVNVLLQDLPAEISTLEQYVAVSELQIRDYAKDGEVISSSGMSHQGKKGHAISFYHTQGLLRVRADQYYFIVGSKAYVVTFSMEKKKETEYAAIGAQLLKSFRFN